MAPVGAGNLGRDLCCLSIILSRKADFGVWCLSVWYRYRVYTEGQYIPAESEVINHHHHAPLTPIAITQDMENLLSVARR